MRAFAIPDAVTVPLQWYPATETNTFPDSVHGTNTTGSTPLHFSSGFGAGGNMMQPCRNIAGGWRGRVRPLQRDLLLRESIVDVLLKVEWV